MANTVYGLFLRERHEGDYLEAIFTTKKAAWKEALRIKRERITEDLEFYKQTGEESAEWCYREAWEPTYRIFIVKELEVRDE